MYQGAMEEAMDQEHFKMRRMLQAIDEEKIEGAIDGASNGSVNNVLGNGCNKRWIRKQWKI
jgi:hypothetical protein